MGSKTRVAGKHPPFLIMSLYGLLWCLDHWIIITTVLLGLGILLPFLAPIFMHWGWLAPARIIYALYSVVCHQMAQRSFFLFGTQPMYTVRQFPVIMTGNTLADMTALRDFVGNVELGWKVAWSDRMAYMYGSMWAAGIGLGWLKRSRTLKPLNLFSFVLLLLPMGIDGLTHVLSDTVSGITGGFRYDNRWLADLTGHVLPDWFYIGDAFGSFNAWMRLISGLTFGIGVVWLIYPHLDRSFSELAATLRAKLIHYNRTVSVQSL
jgi:uncharacterized membrane protein